MEGTKNSVEKSSQRSSDGGGALGVACAAKFVSRYARPYGCCARPYGCHARPYGYVSFSAVKGTNS